MTRLEREKQVQKQKNILYVGFIAFLVLLIIFVGSRLAGNSMKAKASLDGNYCYESILVEEGDTLWSIAETNQKSYAGSLEEYILEIKEVNNLSTDSIKAGEYLILPIYNGSL